MNVLCDKSHLVPQIQNSKTQLTYSHFAIISGHPDKPGLHGKNAATQQLKPLEFAQCLLTGSLLQGNLLKGIDNCSGAARSVV